MKGTILTAAMVALFILANTAMAETEAKPNEEVEYIEVGKKEQGIKIFLEGGGGVFFSGGVVYRLNPIFGIGLGVGYTSPPYRNYGVSIALKVETVPLWINMGAMKLNVLLGLNGIYFIGSETQYVGGSLGMELVLKDLPLLVPSVNVYLYQNAGAIVPQLSFQLRFCL